MSRDLLVEIGTEELPPRALRRLSEAFAAAMAEELTKASLAHAGLHPYATPRRLALLISGLVTSQQDQESMRRGPAISAAFGDDGCPTKAAQGFARSCGVPVDELEKLETDKGAWLAYREHRQGQATTTLVPQMVQAALERLPVPKRMHWGSSTVEFVRPVHWVVLLFGDEVIDAQILGVRAGRETRGHRFHYPHALYLAEPEAYAPLLETEGRVVADFDTRREVVRARTEESAAKLEGRAVVDDELLDEVTAMVEWPVAVAGSFEERFLDVPAEALISTMKVHQKYFHVVNARDELMPYFIAVSNIDSREPEQVRRGNERVIRPRLADAEFFWNQDRKKPLEARREALKDVIFQRALGTLYGKSERIAALAGALARHLGFDGATAQRAAQLCKCDLMTQMVGEFPELQGVMGRYYARHDGEPGEVAIAIDEHYLPRHAADDVPETPAGQAVAIADKLDSLVGIFGIGQAPTGDKDPFALRRAALGVLRVLIERGLDLDLRESLAAAAERYDAVLWGSGAAGRDPAETIEAVYGFMMERLRGYLYERGVRPVVFEAVRVCDPSRPYDFERRARAVTEFLELPEAEALAAANKRIHNILKQAGEAPEISGPEPPRPGEPAEQALLDALGEVADRALPRFSAGEYTAGLRELARLRAPVDAFFDQVMVLVEDGAVRAGRLHLLRRIRDLFLQVADVSRLQG